jgi:hypothetical protein
MKGMGERVPIWGFHWPRICRFDRCLRNRSLYRWNGGAILQSLYPFPLLFPPQYRHPAKLYYLSSWIHFLCEKAPWVCSAELLYESPVFLPPNRDKADPSGGLNSISSLLLRHVHSCAKRSSLFVSALNYSKPNDMPSCLHHRRRVHIRLP